MRKTKLVLISAAWCADGGRDQRHGASGRAAAEGDPGQGGSDEAGSDAAGGANPEDPHRTVQRPRHEGVSTRGTLEMGKSRGRRIAP